MLSSGCGAPSPAVITPAAPPAEVEATGESFPPAIEFPHERVWTAFRDVTMRSDSGSVLLPRPFTALDVIRADSAGVQVRCTHCEGAPAGRVRHEEIVHTPETPSLAAWSTLTEFALAVRQAAAHRDTAALAPVMAREFTFSFVGRQGVTEALGAWAADGLSTLDQVPALLDQGLTLGGLDVWVAPRAFAETVGYDGLRLGFRRSPEGEWEWLFLIGGEGMRR